MRIGRTIPPAASPIYVRDIINGFKGLIRGQREIERFRSELKDYFGSKHCFLVSSGKTALTVILRALHGLQPERDEVIIPAFICYSVPSAIARAGLKIKLCDVNPDTLDFDYDQLEDLITQSAKLEAERQLKAFAKKAYPVSDTRHPVSSDNGQQTIHRDHADPRLLAVMPAHLFGLPANVEHVRSLVGDPLVSIVEDAAQAFGAQGNGQKLGTLGDVGFFSLGRGKALSMVEGGIILTDRDDIADRIGLCLSDTKKYSAVELIRLIINAISLILFQDPALFWFPKGLPFLRVGDTIYDHRFKIRNISAFQAGMAKNWQSKLEKFHESRKKNSRYWTSLAHSSDFNCYRTKNGGEPNLLRYPVKIADKNIRASMLKSSQNEGLGIMPTYPDSINGINELRDVFKGQIFPAAEKLPHQLITLPIHPYVSPKDIKKISNVLSEANNK